MIMSTNCSAAPLELRYGNVTLRTANPSSSPKKSNKAASLYGYGVEFSIGGQTFAFTPNPNSYGSFVYGFNKTCEGIEQSRVPVDCYPKRTVDPGFILPNSDQEAVVGGIYSWVISNTSTITVTIQNNGGSDITVARDILSLGGIKLGDLEFQIAESIYPNWPGAYLGMDRNSSLWPLLSDLIPSPIWSFFIGWEGTTSETTVDGSVILGGYDRAISGLPFVELPLSSSPDTYDPRYLVEYPCRAIINIDHMQIFGQIVPNFSPFKACIDPTFWGIEVPGNLALELKAAILKVAGRLKNEVFNEMLLDDFTGIWHTNSPLSEPASAFALNRSWYQSVLLEGYTVTNGIIDLEVEEQIIKEEIFVVGSEEHNISISIPDHQLFKEMIETSTEATADRLKGGDFVILPISGVYDTEYVRFGRPFLSSAYFYMDSINEKFGLAPISGSKDMNRTTKDITLFPEGCIGFDKSNSSSTNSTSITPKLFPPDHISPDSLSPDSSRINLRKNDIIALVLGLIAGLGTLVVGIWLLRKYFRQLFHLPLSPVRPDAVQKDGNPIHHMADHFDQPGNNRFYNINRPDAVHHMADHFAENPSQSSEQNTSSSRSTNEVNSLA